MCTCADPPARLSVHEDCVDEANRFKWIESEKAGRDLGVQALIQWVKEHWNGYLRSKWIEHIEGVNFWIELDRDDFGLLRHTFRDSIYLSEIMSQLKSKKENFDIIQWVIEANLPASGVAEVIEILAVFDINSKRIECELLKRLNS